MLDSLVIKNFRLFKDLTLPRLSRVNLLVGRNNTGKSSLLEAIYLYGTNFENLYDLLYERDEFWENDVKRDKTVLITNYSDNLIKYIFNGYCIPQNSEDSIIIGPEDKLEQKTLRLVFYRLLRQKEGSIERQSFTLDQIELSSNDVEDDLELGLDVIQNDTFLNNIRLIDSYERYRRRMYTAKRFLKERKIANVQRVPTINIEPGELTALWDNVDLTELERYVIECLQLIEPRISGISFKGIGERNRIPIIKLEGIKELLPLKSLGDGINRLLNIILALVNAKDGYLLLDEVENGLYWAVHPKLWEVIFHLSEQLNVQVFATTHSLDCVKGFSKIWSEMPEQGVFYRLESAQEGLITGTKYTADLLEKTLKHDVEFR